MSMSKQAEAIEAGLNPYTFTTEKPVVHYYSSHEDMVGAVVGESHYVIPVDHPNKRLNGRGAFTSTVLAVHPDGTFETRNTIYVPKK